MKVLKMPALPPFDAKMPENPAIFREKTLALGVFLW